MPQNVSAPAVVCFIALSLFLSPADAKSPDEPHFATFSLCAVDLETGESGAAVTTRVPFVGRAVPWVKAGIGAVATQSWTVVEYGPRGLDLLEEGVAPEDALEKLLAADDKRERRQVGLIDMQGRSAAFTGKECGAWAGSRQGPGYTVQANIMVGPEVVEAVSIHFERTAGTGMPLAERMILALEAGQRTGGDKRWGRFQSAAIKIADPGNSGRGGDHISLAIDVVELKRMLHALGHWRKELQEFPERPRFEADPELRTKDPAKFRRQMTEYRGKLEEYTQSVALFDREAMDAVDAFRKERGLDHDGNPRGLVDARFVAAIRKAYYFERNR